MEFGAITKGVGSVSPPARKRFASREKLGEKSFNQQVAYIFCRLNGV